METTMSTSIRFDKLRFVKKLQQTDVNSPEFSEKLAEALDEALEQSQGQLATKADLKAFELATKSDLKELELRIISEVNSIIYKMAGLIIAGVGMLMGIMKFFN